MEKITKKEALDIVKNFRHCYKIDGWYPEDERIAITLSDGTFIYLSEYEERKNFDARKIIKLEYFGSNFQGIYTKINYPAE